MNGNDPSQSPSRPVLIYDGDCGFCRRWVGRWHDLTGYAIEFAPSQEAAQRFPQIPRQAFDESVWLVEPDGTVAGAAEAVFRSLSLAGKKSYLLWGYEHLPGFAPASEWLYRLVSHNRGTLDQIDMWLIPNPLDPRYSYRLARSFFLRGLGLIYLFAFLSLWVQIDGLIGSRGILPARQFIANLNSSQFSTFHRLILLPTLCLFNSSDAFLHTLSLGGAGLSVLLIVGLIPVPVLALLWLFYLSLTNVGQVFLGYQWDALLLEAGFLAIFFAPLHWRIESPAPPSRIGVFLLRWLLFRIMFLSGLIKLASNDPNWHSLSALRFHYQTQPLPTWTSWYMQQAPNWFQLFSVLVVFTVELLAPLLFFARRRLRLIACWATIAFQILIALTGNYGFFNLLTIVLCITLLDDAAIRWLMRRCPSSEIPRSGAALKWPLWLMAPLACILIPLSMVPALHELGRDSLVPDWLENGWESVQQFDSVNAYGLFAVMTTTRNELIIEGSNDGENWLSYEFKWKPGDVMRAPRFCIPHMPRLDWQMWFAALSPSGNREFLLNLLDRLHEGSPQVTALLQTDPFAKPPRYLRIVVYRYRFTTSSQRAQTGAWWRREPVGQLSLP